MTPFGLLSRMASKRYSDWKAGPAAKPVRTPAPFGLCQGAVVEPPLVPVILAQAAGSLFPDLAPHQTVEAVGTMTLFGQQVVRSYLGDDLSFVQSTSAPGISGKVSELRLYTLLSEVIPPSGPAGEAVWADFIGSPETRLRDTNTGKDVVTQEAVDPLVGFFAYQLADPATESLSPHVRFAFFPPPSATRPLYWVRSWEQGSHNIQPKVADEFLHGTSSMADTVRHSIMAYHRKLGDVTEHLLVEILEYANNDALVRHFVGLDVSSGDLKILTPSG